MTPMAPTATRRVTGLVICGLVALTVLTGCGGNASSPVCSSLAAVEKSVNALTEVKLEPGALTDLQSKLAQVQKDLGQLSNDAQTEFGRELDGVETAYTQLRTSVDEAAADPTATTVSGVGVALDSLANEMQHLQ